MQAAAAEEAAGGAAAAACTDVTPAQVLLPTRDVLRRHSGLGGGTDGGAGLNNGVVGGEVLQPEQLRGDCGRDALRRQRGQVAVPGRDRLRSLVAGLLAGRSCCRVYQAGHTLMYYEKLLALNSMISHTVSFAQGTQLNDNR